MHHLGGGYVNFMSENIQGRTTPKVPLATPIFSGSPSLQPPSKLLRDELSAGRRPLVLAMVVQRFAYRQQSVGKPRG